MTSNLVARWNFEGDNVEVALADKATGGTVEDNLIEYYPNKGNEGVTSPIVIENGTAYIPKDTGIYLAANNSTNFDVSMATHSFQYVDWCFDGEDIIFTVRETAGDVDYSKNEYFHNGYHLTFYRLANYRSLLDYEPPVEQDPIDTGIPEDTADGSDTTSGNGKYFIIGGSIVAGLVIAGIVIWIIVKKKSK